jgi:hypothetical protein
MSSYPHTEKIVAMFQELMLEHPTNVPAAAPFYLSLPTISVDSWKTGELRISPEFQTRDELEVFCGRHHYDYFTLEDQMRELGAVPEMFWKKPSR